MPVSKQAEKKLRHDRLRTKTNAGKKLALRDAIKKTRKQPTAKSLTEVFSLLDKATKTNLIHKNKAARLKSRLSKLLVAKKK